MTDIPVQYTVPLEPYLAAYPRSQHLPRLTAIAKGVPEKKYPEVLQSICTLLSERFRESRDVAQYKEFVGKFFEKGVNVQLDAAWVAEREKQTSAELEALQVALGQATNSLQKPKIREALFNLAEFYATMGNMQNAMKCVTRSRESCTEDKHTAEMCQLAVRVNLFRGSYAILSPYVSRAEQLAERLSDQHFVYFRVASALVQLDKRNYKQVAQMLSKLRRRRETPVDVSAFAEIFPPGDMVLIASLCALATFTRDELSKFLSLPDFKIVLESEPVTRTLLHAFYDCHYAAALAALEELAPRIRLDFFLGPHAVSLTRTIRESAIKQYSSPYLSLDLHKMADAFKTDMAQIQHELSSLIIRGEIHARIDKAAGVLRASVANDRADAFAHVLEVGEDFADDTEMCLRLLSMQRNGIEVKQKQLQRMKEDPRGGPDSRRHR